jgi:hypothetical protein
MKNICFSIPEDMYNKLELDRKLVKRSTYYVSILEKGINCREGNEQQ